MSWIKFDKNDAYSYPEEGVNVLVTDGDDIDVAHYLMSGEYKWRKNSIEYDDTEDFTEFEVTKWREIDLDGL